MKIKFSLAEPIYLARYSSQEITSLESQVALFLRNKMSNEIGFLLSTDTSAEFTVLFRLGEPNGSKHVFHDIRFQILLTGPDGDTRTAYLPFRDFSHWTDRTGDWRQFTDEIKSQFLKFRLDNLTSGVWSMVSVASEGTLIHKPPNFKSAWVLPFRRTDLCIDFSSEFKLATKVSTELGFMPRDFFAEALMAYNPAGVQDKLRERLLCTSKPGQLGWDIVERSSPSAVKIQQIFVVRYIPMTGCQGPLPPTAAATSFMRLK